MKFVLMFLGAATISLAAADISLKSGYNYIGNGNMPQAIYMQQQPGPAKLQQSQYRSQTIIYNSFAKPHSQHGSQGQNQLTRQYQPRYVSSLIPQQQLLKQQPQQWFARQPHLPNDAPPSLNYLQPPIRTAARYHPRTRIPKKAIITKSIYIHSAPEESDDEIDEEIAELQRPRKHFNILFVKAPTQTNQAAALNLAKSLKQEKTVVYILSKKTSAADLQDAIPETVETHNKPQVFFIKYHTDEEAENAKQKIQSQYDQLGGSTVISDEGIAPTASVIGSLDIVEDEDEEQHQQLSLNIAHDQLHTAINYEEEDLVNDQPQSSNLAYLPPLNE